MVFFYGYSVSECFVFETRSSGTTKLKYCYQHIFIYNILSFLADEDKSPTQNIYPDLASANVHDTSSAEREEEAKKEEMRKQLEEVNYVMM